jgi:signal recognition particle subunit SRP54
MFETLTQKLEGLLKSLRGKGLLTEQNIDEALQGVRMSLLEADVHFSVVKGFIDRVRAKAVGVEVMKSLTPGLQVVKIVHEELTELMGKKGSGLQMSPNPPTVIMLVGLQGSGKTTTVGKLARAYQAKGLRPLLVAADLQRPAAVAQLQTHATTLKVSIVLPDGETDPLVVARRGIEQGRAQDADMVIVDTAGRLQVDEPLMDELVRMKSAISPHEILLVADAMTGQVAVNVAKGFHDRLGLTGVIFTKTEGDARSGAILSIRQMTGAPVKFIGTGEKLDALEAFHPDRMASRILGMGDALSLIEMAQENYTKDHAVQLTQKIRTDRFTLDDFSAQMKQFKNIGSIEKLLSMIPGMGRMQGQIDVNKVSGELKAVEAMISSMTRREREDPAIINGSRRLRVAKGSGTSVQEVNRLLKQFSEAKKMMKQMTAGKKPDLRRLAMR